MTLRKFFLFPFSIVYNLVTGFRNFLYDKKFLKSVSFGFPVICIGNLKVGGTGKTPHVEYLTDFLSSEFSVGIVSRGYGRKTKGYIEAYRDTEASKIGDEPAQYRRKFSENVRVAVCEKRSIGIKKLKESHPQLKAIILDDAMQHRSVQAGLIIMLTEYKHPFFKDWILPGGLLRESRQGVRRADMVIVTKCQADITENQKSKISDQIRRYAQKNVPVFFTRYIYGAPTALYAPVSPFDPSAPCHVLAVSGIANPQPFLSFLQESYTSVKSLRYSDHYDYTTKDEEKIMKEFQSLPENGNKLILTTEKDAVKFKDLHILKEVPVAYIPVKASFLEKENEFRQLVRDFLN